MVEYEAIIGLEIHVELSTQSKMFCGCKVEFGGDPNTRTCPVCLGLPGSLPVPNKRSIENIVLVGLALSSEISELSQFHRKNYFYPDMPKNFQISQYDTPVCNGGYLDIPSTGNGLKKIGITRVHMEEDTGKLIHIGKTGRIAGADYALVDFNRAGTPLVEIVTEPDMRTPEEARDFLKKLRNILLHLGVSDCSMEEGSMRCDVNVSTRPKGSNALGTKVEMKNINSFRALYKGLQYEIERQKELLRGGSVIVQETRHWDAEKNRTTTLRTKEEAHDYRYFPEPDLVPMTFSREFVERQGKRLPELPDARYERLIKNYGLNQEEAAMLSGSKETGDFFEKTMEGYKNPKTIINWMMGEMSYHLNNKNLDFANSPVSPEQLVELVKMIDDGTISGKMAKDVFEDMFESGKSASLIVKEKGLVQITDVGEIEKVVTEVIFENQSVVEDYLSGKEKALAFLVGQVMRKTKGKANPGLVNNLLKSKISR